MCQSSIIKLLWNPQKQTVSVECVRVCKTTTSSTLKNKEEKLLIKIIFLVNGRPLCKNNYICSLYFVLTTFTQNGVGDILPKKQSEVGFKHIFLNYSTNYYSFKLTILNCQSPTKCILKFNVIIIPFFRY